MSLKTSIGKAIQKVFPSKGTKQRGYRDLVKVGRQNQDWSILFQGDDADLWQNAYALTARVRDLFKCNPLYIKYRELMWSNIFGSEGILLRMKIQETENRTINTPEKLMLDAYAQRINDLRTWAAKRDGGTAEQYRAYKLADAMERSNSGDIAERKAMIQVGDPDLFANELVQRRRKEWSRKEFSDLRGTRNYFQQCLLRLIGGIRDGDFFIRMIRDPGINKFGFSLQLINAEWCDRFLNVTLQNGNVVIMGIEYQMTPWGLGTVVAYYFITRAPSDWQYSSSGGLFGFANPAPFHQRIEASEIIHYARPVDADATRPAPWVASTIPKGRQLDQYELAEVIAAREAACKVGFLYSDVAPDGGSSGVDIDPATGLPAVQNAGPGDTVALPQYVKYQQNDPQHPTANFETFRKGMVRSISAGMPAADYNTLANDLENINFSAGRLGRLDTNEMSMLIQRFDIDTAERPIFEAWLEMSLITGAIALPLAKFDKFNKPIFQGRRWAQVDEVKAEQASAMRITNNKSSWSLECALDGKDFDEVIFDKAEDLMTMEQLGISPSTTVDNNTVQTATDDQAEPGDEPGNQNNGATSGTKKPAKPKKDVPVEGKNGTHDNVSDRITIPITFGKGKKTIKILRDENSRISGAETEETD